MTAHEESVMAIVWPSSDVAYSVGWDRRLTEWAPLAGTKTIDVSLGSLVSGLAVANGSLYFGTYAGEMHCLTRVPALLEQPKSFRSELRHVLPEPAYPGHLKASSR